MIAEQLKKSILQAAIQGKLTEQLPEDGNARDLLKEIQKEKARLIKEGKIKKEKPLPEITEDEIPFDIPDNWCWVRLGEIIDLKSGQDMTPDNYNSVNKGIPYITGASCFLNETLLIDRWTEIPRSVANKGDLLITCKGTVGEMAFLKEEKAHIARQVMAIKDIGPSRLEYILIFLKYYVTELKSMAKSMIPGINREMVLNASLPLPPIKEQKRIVERLNEFLSECDKLSNDETKLEELQKSFPKKMKDAILQYAIQGKLTEQLPEDGDARDLLKEIQKEKARLIKEGKIKKEKPLPEITEDEIPFEIPENWCWVRLGDVGETNIGLTYTPSDVSTSGTLVLRSGNIQDNEIAYSDNVYVNCKIPESKKCRIGDILICARNGSKRLVGKAAIIDQEKMSFGAFMALYRSSFNQYIHKYLSSPYFRADFDGVSTTTINQITQNNLKERLLPLPPVAEQERIVKCLEELLPLCEELK